jgi:hypothetical protein
MAKSLSPLERVADKLTTIHTAMEALFKHTTKAVDIRTKADRTTLTWPYLAPTLPGTYLTLAVCCVQTTGTNPAELFSSRW